VYTLRYKTEEQAYLAGLAAALVSVEANPACRLVGLVAAQEYPVMNDIILPAFARGARAVSPDFETAFRVVGNWFDAEKAAALAGELYAAGAGAVLCISGGANEGVVQAAREAGGKVVWFDSDGSGGREDVVAGSAVVAQDRAAREKTAAALAGTLPFGQCEEGGVAAGYVDFVPGPAASAALRERLARETAALRR